MQAQTSAECVSYTTLQIPSAFSVGKLQTLVTKIIQFFKDSVFQLLPMY